MIIKLSTSQKPQRSPRTPEQKQLAIDTYRDYVAATQREPEDLYTPEQVKLHLYTNPNTLPKRAKSSTETPSYLKLL